MQSDDKIHHAKDIVYYVRTKVYRESQIKFAQRMKSKQSLISKYEAGLISPPANIIIHCMNEMNKLHDKVNDVEKEENITMTAFIKLLKSHLSGDEMKSTRYLIACLVESLSSKNSM